MADLHLAARRAAEKFGVDPGVFLAMIQQESGFQPNVRSPKGAQGIAQFIPSTAKAYGVNLHDNRVTDDLEGAARYLRANLDRTGGNYHQALSIYNSGRPEGYKSIPETANYVRSILGASGGVSAQSARASGSRAVKSSRTIPGVDRSPQRKALILQFLQQRNRPGSVVGLATGLAGAKDTPSKTVTVTRHAASTPSSQHGGLATFDGKPVSAWIKPLLQYARDRGWKGTVQSGYRSDAAQTAIYKRGTRPAAVPKSMGGAGSKHEQTGFLRGAVDVSDAATLDRILRAKHSRLKFAGARDPVHFSVPTNGSY